DPDEEQWAGRRVERWLPDLTALLSAVRDAARREGELAERGRMAAEIREARYLFTDAHMWIAWAIRMQTKLERAEHEQPAEAHVWKQVGWEYDDSFFRCDVCGLKTHQRRGTPAETAAECAESGIRACTGKQPAGGGG